MMTRTGKATTLETIGWFFFVISSFKQLGFYSIFWDGYRGVLTYDSEAGFRSFSLIRRIQFAVYHCCCQLRVTQEVWRAELLSTVLWYSWWTLTAWDFWCLWCLVTGWSIHSSKFHALFSTLIWKAVFQPYLQGSILILGWVQISPLKTKGPCLISSWTLKDVYSFECGTGRRYLKKLPGSHDAIGLRNVGPVSVTFYVIASLWTAKGITALER